MTTRAKVEELLKERPQLRNSDKQLLMAYWETEGLMFSQTQKQIFLNCTVAETITRDRRDLRADYPATEEVEEGRYKKYQETTNYYRTQARLF